MQLSVESACGCNPGRIRARNEDNFYYKGSILEESNNGLFAPISFDSRIKNGQCIAIFDGMGGENYGNTASFSAAHKLQRTPRTFLEYLMPEKQYLQRLVHQINDGVVSAKHSLKTSRMGTTMVALYFSGRSIYSCNLGDSRAYRLRGENILQISKDHVSQHPGGGCSKPPLTQYLGIDPEEMLIEPYIVKDKMAAGDQYLICSDGLTDMLNNFEICDIMLRSKDAKSCVEQLIQSALDHGGRDNITAIVCRIHETRK